MKFSKNSWDELINDARLNPNKSTKDLLDNITNGWLLDSDEFDKVQEIIYDARSDSQFDYIKAASVAGLLEELVGFITSSIGSIGGWRTSIGVFCDDTLLATFDATPERKKMSEEEFKKAYLGTWSDVDFSVELIDRNTFGDDE